jgi:hypothetical protein
MSIIFIINVINLGHGVGGWLLASNKWRVDYRLGSPEWQIEKGRVETRPNLVRKIRLQAEAFAKTIRAMALAFPLPFRQAMGFQSVRWYLQVWA